MKKCPFCKAEIEDNARFCLYCMKPLEEKCVIEASTKRRKIWVPLVFVLVVCLTIACILLLFALGKDSLEQPDNDATTIGTIGADAPTDETTKPLTEQPKEDSPSTEQPEDDPTTELPDNPPTDTVPCNHSYSDGYCLRCKAPDYKNPKVVFEYREVGPNDYFSPDSYIPGSDIVITGVKNPTPDGVYEVPSFLDGKRVVGITSLAFSGTDARKVTLAETIIRINQNAFSGCYNMEALYVKSDQLFLSRSAFIEPVHRNCTLTIYCSSTCMVDDDLYGACYLKDIARTLGADWEEWDG